MVFLGDLPFSPHLTIDSAQNEGSNKTQIKKIKKILPSFTGGLQMKIKLVFCIIFYFLSYLLFS